MTDDKKHDDKDRKKVSDEELEDVAGGNMNRWFIEDSKKRDDDTRKDKRSDMRKNATS